MNKKTTAIAAMALMMLTVSAQAQDLPINENGRVEFQKVIEAPEMSQDEIYLKVLDWFGNTFRNAESVINFQNRETGRISGRFFDEYPSHKALGIQYYADLMAAVSFEIRDGRLRVTINDFTLTNNSTFESTFLNRRGQAKAGYKMLIQSMIEKNNQLFENIETHLQTQEQDDW